MKRIKKNLGSALLIAMTIIFCSFDLPEGWYKAGSRPKSYDMSTDKGAGPGGKNVATIKSLDKKINGFGTLMQDCLSDKYSGKRVRMSGYVKTKDVKGWAALWLRVDKKGSRNSIGFDNMLNGKKDRSIKGTTEWTKYEIVLDVPMNASGLAYGALLDGTGQVWFGNLNFEIVDSTVSVTGKGESEMMPYKEPVNLDFEK